MDVSEDTEAVKDFAVDIVRGPVAVDERLSFLTPFADTLKSTIDLCDRAIVNKTATKQYKDRLLEVEQLVQTALEMIGNSEPVVIRPFTEKFLGIMISSIEFIESHTKKGFLSWIIKSKKVEEQFGDLDRQLTEVMRDMSFAVGLAQYKIVAKTYEIFNSEKFFVQNGGPDAFKSDDKVLEEFAAHLDCSVNDLRRELVDMHHDLRFILQELKDLIKSPTHEAPEIKERLLRVDRERVLGEGAVGIVFGGKYNGEDVAIKTLKRAAGQYDEKTMRKLRQEVRTLFILGKYPGFVRLFGANLEPGKGELCMVLELADGSLDELIHSTKLQVDLTFSLKTSIALDITRAMDALHELGMIFRDLKPQNVLIFFKGQDRQIVAKLTDFGLAKGVCDKTSSAAGGNIKGTIPYMAPEVFQKNTSCIPYSFASDVFALGITLNELMMEQRPFHAFDGNAPSLMKHIECGNIPDLFPSSSIDLPAHKAMESIIKNCVAYDPLVRPKISVVVEDLQRVQDTVEKNLSTSPIKPRASPRRLSPHSSQASETETLISSQSQDKKLAELSVDDVVHLMRNLEMPDKCCTFVREQKITGRVLGLTKTLEDLRECGFQPEVLSKFHAMSLLESISLFQVSGVPSKYLRSECFHTEKTHNIYTEVHSSISQPLPDTESEQNNSFQQRCAFGVNLQFLGVIRCYCAEAKRKGVSPLFLASEAGDMDGVHVLLQCTHDLVQNESEDVKNFMAEDALERVNKPEAKEGQRTPLHIATFNGKTETVLILLTHRANIEAKSENNRTPLHIAAEEGHTETVSALIARKANIVAKDANLRTPLHIAALNGHAETVSALITHKANIIVKDEFQSTPWHIAAEQGHLETVSLLITLRANIEAKDKDQRTLLHIAAAEGQTEMVSLLIKHRAKIDAMNEQSTPLHVAVTNGHMDIVSLLLSEKANIEAKNEEGSTPLGIAVTDGNTKIVSLLLSHRANINTINGWEHQTPLHVAVIEGHSEIVSLLLTHKANTEAKDEELSTPLFYAVSGGNSEILSLLIKHNADVNVTNEEGQTLLDIAENENIKTILKNAQPGFWAFLKAKITNIF